MSPTDWFIELEGDNVDLERLAHAFTEPPVMIAKEGDRYRLRDERLSELEDAGAVRAELHRTLLRITSLARLQFGDDVDVHPGGLGSPNDGGGVTWYASATVTGRARVSATLSAIGPDGEIVPPPPSPLPVQRELAATDANVYDALYFLQRSDPDWIELYKANEIVRADVRKIEGRGCASEGELSSFTRTANHPQRQDAGAATLVNRLSRRLTQCRWTRRELSSAA
jgi:hypothetical protein